MPPWQYPEGMRDRVVALRDQYERVFIDLIEKLPLRADIDPPVPADADGCLVLVALLVQAGWRLAGSHRAQNSAEHDSGRRAGRAAALLVPAKVSQGLTAAGRTDSARALPKGTWTLPERRL